MKMLEDLEEVVKKIADYESDARDVNGCSSHVDAPHGFDRNGSHNADRYVCTCEGWCPNAHESSVLASKAIHYIRTHHATIHDMAKRLLEIQAENSMLRAGLEAAERDAARWRYVYTEHMVIRDRGGIYHGDVDYPTAEEIDQAMQETGR